MQIIQASSNNSTKWTVTYDRTNRYPAPGEIIAVSEEEINAIVAKANIVLEKDDSFLQSSITTMSDANYYSKKLFAPVAAEQNSKEKFDIVLRVESIEMNGNKTYVVTNCPFLNMPEGVDIRFNADEATVVDIKIATEHPITKEEASIINKEKLATYYTKKGDAVHYEMLVPSPEKINDWLVSNLIKEFSLIFDFTKEIETAVSALGRNSSIHNFSRDVFKQPVKAGNNIKVISLNDEVEDILKSPEDSHVYDDNAPIEDDFISQHPLYQYTSDVTISVFEEIEEQCKLIIDNDVVTDIMQKVLQRMLSTKMQIIPPPRQNY